MAYQQGEFVDVLYGDAPMRSVDKQRGVALHAFSRANVHAPSVAEHSVLSGISRR
jgi:hypothetical protein